MCKGRFLRPGCTSHIFLTTSMTKLSNVCALQSRPLFIEQQLVRPAKASGGEMGFTAIHIETGRRITLNSSKRFPMASTYKLPIAVQLLKLEDEGKEQLDHIIRVGPRDMRPGGI